MRVLVLAVILIGLSVVSHQLAGGAYPGAVPLVGLTALAVALIGPLTRRELGLPRLLAVLGAGQVGLHAAFERLAELAPAAAGPAHPHHHGAESDARMLAAHAVATLALALLLRHGDALLWRLWTWLSLRHLPSAPPPAVVVPEAAACGAPFVVRASAHSMAVQARAPPLPV